uniref:Apolipoprotein N-acyltransferase n=1 Tax=Candidatus Kentrum sp. MB TaxID=2138164 RepID=A0A450XG47_9GAMM|nr:MAG: apolipoprotein N-acyltransferase [Candidatus Kentron sp. MB]VFK32375.1 MAG: apolipoprotein N-acyltransferase [Candidatus Kentron sp. MB]VFK75858.1 MAG: apolipoprotein N-acyltransferase [Candidatus Kentron sp. MB]
MQQSQWMFRALPDPLKAPPKSDRRHGAVGDGVALGAGLLMPFAFAPFGVYGLTIVALALLFGSVAGVGPGRALWRGWLFGVAMFGVGVFWIHESFQFASVALPLALLLTGGLIGVLALYPGLFGVLAAWLWRRWVSDSRWPSVVWRGGGALLVLPAVWVVLEWVRGWLLSGFPWLQVGYAHIDSPLAGLAPVLGVYGISWAVAVSAGCLLLAVWLLFPGGGRQGCRVGARVAGLAALVLLVAGLWGGCVWLSERAWTSPGRTLQVALIQGNVPQDRKWLASARLPTLRRYLSLTRRELGRDLVVWPETALPGLYGEFAGFVAGLRAEARAKGTDVLLGAPTLRASGRYYNSVAALTAAGEAFYHKGHLVPFGEYLPMAGVLRGVVDFLQIPMSDFSPGGRREVLSAAGERVGVSVCYEASFGRDVLPLLPEATLLVNVSNDAWFGDSLGPHQNLQMARMRARESGRYLLRATNTGISALIDDKGEVQARAPQFEVAVVTGEVKGMSGITPYARYGDWMVALAAMAVLALAWVMGGLRRGR